MRHSSALGLALCGMLLLMGVTADPLAGDQKELRQRLCGRERAANACSDAFHHYFDCKRRCQEHDYGFKGAVPDRLMSKDHHSDCDAACKTDFQVGCSSAALAVQVAVVPLAAALAVLRLSL